MSFDRLVVIGASTGGPPAVSTVMQALDPTLPFAYVIVQHMPAGFTASFAQRLDRQSRLAVQEAATDDQLSAGKVFVAPGGAHLSIGARGILSVLPEDAVDGPRPSVDLVLKSAAKWYDNKVTAVVMTGMGADGAMGSVAVKRAGGHVIAQDQATSTIYGMPKAVADMGVVDIVAPLSRLAKRIMDSGNTEPVKRAV